MPGQVGAFGEVLPKEPVGVLVRSALPGTVWIAEVDSEPGLAGKRGMLSHLGPAIPRQGLSKLLGQEPRRINDRVLDGDCTVPGQRRTVLHADVGVELLHPRQGQQYGVSSRSF